MTTLSGKVAVVTGASRGIGRAIAERLGREGASVVVNYMDNAAKAQEVVQAIRASGAQAIAVQADVRRREDVAALFDRALAEFGHLDILINNAAGRNIFKPTAEMTQDDYDSMFGIARGVYFALQEAAQHIADGGRIVSLSTGGTSMPMAGGGAYIGSKAAVEQFSNCLAKELGPRGVTVNTLAPGVTDTDGVTLEKAQLDQLVGMTPLSRLGRPEDIAAAVLLLVSEDAHWITGQNIRATGGIV